jgi:hypothetical protein
MKPRFGAFLIVFSRHHKKRAKTAQNVIDAPHFAGCSNISALETRGWATTIAVSYAPTHALTPYQIPSFPLSGTGFTKQKAPLHFAFFGFAERGFVLALFGVVGSDFFDPSFSVRSISRSALICNGGDSKPTTATAHGGGDNRRFPHIGGGHGGEH